MRAHLRWSIARLLLGLLVVSALVVPAEAVVTSSNPAVVLHGQQNVTYPDFNNFVGPTQIVSKTFNDLSPISTDISWEAGDEDFGTLGGGFRWFEYITNNTNQTWIDFHLTISGNADAEWIIQSVSSTQLIPGRGDSDFSAGAVSTIFGLQGDGVISPDGKELWFEFPNNPVAPGEVLQIHTNIAGIGLAGGEFTLTQHPSIVPAPAAAVLAMIGLGVTTQLRRGTGRA